MRYITTHEAPATGLRGIADTSWHTRGACYGLHPADADEVFFPPPRDHIAIAEAKELCALCPVRTDCLNYAVENGLKDGIWGGLTEAERRPWHDGLPHRLDYRRVRAFFDGRDVHLTEAERKLVIDHAYLRGWRPDRLAAALQISNRHARDLLRQAALKVFDRDRTYGVPQPKRKRRKTSPSPDAPTSSRPRTRQPTPRTAPSTTTSAPDGKAI